MSSLHATHSVPRPPRRVLTRVVLPLAIVGGATAAVLWAGWRSFAPAMAVNVVQVVVKAANDFMEQDAGAGGTATAPPATGTGARLSGPSIQAPGWVEPAPFPVMVAALTPGTVKEMRVLEGERVTKGQILVELYDEEQVIALQLAQALLEEQEARRTEMADELTRKEKLVAGGAVSAAEAARLRLRLGAMDATVRAARAERDMKALVLERTKVRAPRDGVVMARLASPGMTAGVMQDGKPLIELYDPSSLQVRADVPLADAGLIAAGQLAEIQVDVLPERVFRGTVARVTSQADIAKNTVQAKVLITDPAPELKPEMLARVRIFPRGAAAARAAGNGAVAAGGGARQHTWAPTNAIRRNGTNATALVVVGLHDGTGTAEQRTLQLAGNEQDNWQEVLTGLRAGDLLITTDGAQPQPGDRVRVANAPAEGSSHANH